MLPDKLVRLYGLVASDPTRAQNRVATTYAFVGDFWGFFQMATVDERLIGTQGEQVSKGKLTLDDSVQVPDRALIRVQVNGRFRFFRVLGLPIEQSAFARCVYTCLYVDDDVFTTTGDPD